MFFRIGCFSSQSNILALSILGIQVFIEIVVTWISLEEYLRFFIEHLSVGSISRHILEKGNVVFYFALSVRFSDIW